MSVNNPYSEPVQKTPQDMVEEMRVREAHWVCLYCEASNFNDEDHCDVCANERKYHLKELEFVLQDHISRSSVPTTNLNPWAIAIIIFLLLLLFIT
jgi:hypothetical protein